MFLGFHGFLGLPSDWDAVAAGLSGPVHAPDLLEAVMAEEPSSADQAFDAFARRWVAELASGRWGRRPVLMGYSMGGRLALHVALEAAAQGLDVLRGLVILSAHPGLSETDEAGRAARARWDAEWASRWAGGDWSSAVADWGRLAVFGGRPMPERRAGDFDRAALGRAMRVWSPARQRDLRPELKRLALPTLWVAGGGDEKYAGLYRGLGGWLPRRHRVEIIKGVGHRVLVEAPEAVAELIRSRPGGP